MVQNTLAESIDQHSNSAENNEICITDNEENVIEEFTEVEQTYNEKLTKNGIEFAQETNALYKNDCVVGCEAYGACRIF